MPLAAAFEVADNQAIVLAPTAERGEDIDVLRAKESKERAEKDCSKSRKKLTLYGQIRPYKGPRSIKAAEADKK